MAEPRYTLTREEKSLKNRHMVKCYPSFQDRLSDIEEFNSKLKFYKELAEKQGRLFEFLYETAVELNVPQKETTSFEVRPLTSGLVGRRTLPCANFKKIDNESYLKNSGSKYLYHKSQYQQYENKFENLHENTIYIDHFCKEA